MSPDWPTLFAGLKTVLDPLAAASWPLVLLFCVWFLRTNIRDLMQRAKRLNGFGSEAEFLPSEGGKQLQVAATAPQTIPYDKGISDLPVENDVYS